ncbi:MAG: hypothetical protein A2Z43_01305 [Syntrophobacterales bacterium RBG_19FT_COMBO_59_10]|nr:MAG: hypothetical protein A2Z43_01305 [Syntrophobacterales bacterium RBG_19FT_COMBO_59_10]
MKKDLLLGAGLIFLAVLCAMDLRTVKEPDIIQNQVGVTQFPWLMVLALGFLGIALMISSLVKMKAAGGVGKAKIGREGLRSKYAVPGLMFMILTAYILLVPVIGFYAMSVAFFVALGLLLGGFGKKNVISVVIGSACTALFVYLIFQVMLQVWMPQGLLF